MKKCLLIGVMFGLLGVAHAAPKVAMCKITMWNEIAYKGKCLFDPYESGSFTLTPIKGEVLFGEISLIDVYITSKGQAEVRGHRLSGMSSRWGSFIRSKSQSACWDSSEFQICAW